MKTRLQMTGERSRARVVESTSLTRIVVDWFVLDERGDVVTSAGYVESHRTTRDAVVAAAKAVAYLEGYGDAFDAKDPADWTNFAAALASAEAMIAMEREEATR
jgi:L-asparaginase II